MGKSVGGKGNTQKKIESVNKKIKVKEKLLLNERKS